MTRKGLSTRPEPTSLGAMFVHKKSRQTPAFFIVFLTNFVQPMENPGHLPNKSLILTN